MSLFQKHLKGMTLVEMLVAIFIMGIGTIGFTLLFSSSWKTNKFILETGVTAVQVNRASSDIINNLRKVRQADNGDYPIESGDDFDIQVYLDIDNDGVTERVHYWLDTANDQLMRGVREPSAATPPTYASGDGTTSIIANYIVNEAAQPVFYYYNENYPGDTVNNPIATPIAIEDVRLVRVLLRMNIDPIKAPNNINVESFVDLRNLESYDN
ncbi:MAG: type II secretion system protein [Candidatus Moraniibacteriota bacterium]|nr:MAG: type II secretion system protein [Candidatus Moranbacteria bacterium]